MNRTLINTALTLTLTGVLLVAGAPGSSAEEIREADKMVHKALKDRTGTFCKQVLPAWFSVKGEKNVGGFRTLVADCYLGHARLAILGVDDNMSLNKVGLSELPSALLAEEAGMNLDVYAPLAGRTLKDYAKSN